MFIVSIYVGKHCKLIWRVFVVVRQFASSSSIIMHHDSQAVSYVADSDHIERLPCIFLSMPYHLMIHKEYMSLNPRPGKGGRFCPPLMLFVDIRQTNSFTFTSFQHLPKNERRIISITEIENRMVTFRVRGGGVK